MNLAYKDIRYSLGKFLVTAMGVGMLLGIVLIMMGVYKGMLIDAKAMIEDVGADLWVVQEKTLGPIAESSRLFEDTRDVVAAMEGVAAAEPLTFQSLQLPTPKGPMRVMAVGYDPFGKIDPIKRLIEGRVLLHDHYEIVVSDKTGLHIGDVIPILRHRYKVVGITHLSVSSGGIPLVFVSLKDAQELQFSYSNNRIRSDRARGIEENPAHFVNTIVVKIKPGYDKEKIAKDIETYLHKSVYAKEQEEAILSKNFIKMASKQIGMFTSILIVVSTIIIALIIYTMTLEKMKEITIMKLIGISNSKIVSMIAQETLTLGILAFIFANIFAHLIYDKFPKRVVLQADDAKKLFIIVIIASLLASLVGIKKVIQADPTEAIGG